MHRILTALLVLALFAGIGVADDKPVRTDLTPKDLARVRAVTAPTTDFTKPEQFELLPGGAATTKKLVNRDIFSQFSANLSFEDQEQFNLGNGFFTQGLGGGAVLDAGVGRARAAVQFARLPELPSEGRPRPSADGRGRRRRVDVPAALGAAARPMPRRR